ncbi:hypothetical protein LB465_11905 [Salegentibacter sp. LM13S]|uniref:glucosamine inositolphosphorylceramide transferase family protein n=1 Tax=Salegentibacter lacus TaxID=2873599 RepID=UPI001CCEFFB0|nr:hypothetical protein [Salegentibacter lacus]MBZ9631485.1 hypothetical protein [Salegentibacter lacus]
MNFVNDHPQLKIETLILRREVSAFSSNSSFIYRASQALDRKFFSVKNDIFTSVDISNLEEEISVIEVSGIEKIYSYRFTEEKITEVKNLDLDVLIRFGFSILKGDILNTARHGVWSLHHGDNAINRGGPPAFWEVVNRENVTGITLQKLSEDLDGGRVIKKSFIKTNTTSFYRNKNEAFWAGVELFNLALDELSQGILKYEEKKILPFYSCPLYKNPTNITSIKILLSFWSRRIKEVIIEKISAPQWYILYKFRKDSSVEKSIFRYKKLYPPKGYDWADPFIVKEKDNFYLFFEEVKIGSGNGHISLFKFDEKGNLINENPIKVINEEYHLSYPFIFKEDSNYYMLPESADANGLWLYKCEEFPVKWKKHQKIFSNKQIYDASLYFHEGYWYLFGTEKLSQGGNRDQYLHIYYSKELDTEMWTPHPLNPLSLDIRGARPAGKILKDNDKLLRPTQIGAPKYGYGIQLNEIKKLSPTEFIEEKRTEILPKWEKDLKAAHTFNFVEGFSVLDAQKKL